MNKKLNGKLSALFDFQRFQQNPKLEKMINETERKYTGELLEDEMLSGLNAAGEPTGLPMDPQIATKR